MVLVIVAPVAKGVGDCSVSDPIADMWQEHC